MRQTIYASVLSLVVSFIVVLYLVFGFEALVTRDAFGYADLARRIVQGQAYTTRIITPLSWSIIPEIPHPDFGRAPLYPFLIAAGFQLFGIEKLVPILVSSLAFLITVLLVYRIGERFRTSTVGFYAGLITATSPYLYLYGVVTMTESVFTMLFLATVLVVGWEEPHPYLLGVLAGMAYLTRFSAGFFLVGVLWIGYKKAGFKNYMYITRVILAGAITILPWMARNALILGNPLYHHQVYELVSFNQIHSGYSVYFQFNPPSPWIFLVENPLTIIVNWLDAFRKTITRIVPYLLEGLWLLLILSIIWSFVFLDENRSERKGINGFHLLFIFLVACVLNVFVMGLAHVSPRYFVPLIPFLSIFSAAAIEKFIHFDPWMGYVVLVFTLSVNVYLLNQVEFDWIDLREEDYRAVKKFVPKTELLLTNRWLFLPWFSERTILAAPLDYREAREHYPEFNFVYLEAFRWDLTMPNPGRVVEHYRRSKHFKEDFRVLEEFSEGSILYVRKGYGGYP